MSPAIRFLICTGNSFISVRYLYEFAETDVYIHTEMDMFNHVE